MGYLPSATCVGLDAPSEMTGRRRVGIVKLSFVGCLDSILVLIQAPKSPLPSKRAHWQEPASSGCLLGPATSLRMRSELSQVGVKVCCTAPIASLPALYCLGVHDGRVIDAREFENPTG